MEEKYIHDAKPLSNPGFAMTASNTDTTEECCLN
jgi:hypothetical protein